MVPMNNRVLSSAIEWSHYPEPDTDAQVAAAMLPVRSAIAVRSRVGAEGLPPATHLSRGLTLNECNYYLLPFRSFGQMA
jgi:hypothetical protein